MGNVDRTEAERIVALLLEDMTNRRGFRHLFDQIQNEDSQAGAGTETTDAILSRWVEIVARDESRPRMFNRLVVARALGTGGICEDCAARFPADHADYCIATWPKEEG